MDYLIAATVVLLCVLVIWQLWSGHGLRHHLSNRGWMLYLYPGCGACQQQVDILGGDDGGYSPAYMCGIDGDDADRQARCPQQFPTWVNLRTGAVRIGVQDRSDLAHMARSTQ